MPVRDVPPFPVGRKLKLLRVAPDASGELHTFRDAADLDPESYWFDLLHDPRGRVPSGPGYWQTLAARRDMVLTVACNKCNFRRSDPVNELLEKYSGRMRVIDVVLAIKPCDKPGKRCNRTYILAPADQSI